MRQVFLKSMYNLGWGSSNYRTGLGGNGDSASGTTYGENYTKVVVPLNGTFSNLNVYSAAGMHPNYTFTLMVNGIASALTCTLAATSTQAKDILNTVNVVAGDDICFVVNVNPFGSGLGYHVSFSIEFEAAQQFYSITAVWGGQVVDTYNMGGALGNGIMQVLSSVVQLSNAYSICAVAGNITGIGMKTYAGAPGTGVWTGYIVKNQVLQDGSGGTVNTACTMTGASLTAINSFSLPVVEGDHLDFALKRTVTGSSTSTVQVTMSCLFTPTDAESFMSVGGGNNANDSVNTEYRWVTSQQLNLIEAIAQCPIGPRGIEIRGLRVETPTLGVGGSVICTIRKNGVNTAATVTVVYPARSAVISGLSIPFSDGDLIDLETIPINNPTGLTNGFWWGLSLASAAPVVPAAEHSGIYYINPTKAERHDSYYDDEKKIPNPTVKTALIGE